MTKSVGVHQAKTHLSQLLEDVAQGQEVVITRRGEPVARLVALQPSTRSFGIDRHRLAIPEDFDAPLSEETIESFEG